MWASRPSTSGPVNMADRPTGLLPHWRFVGMKKPAVLAARGRWDGVVVVGPVHRLDEGGGELGVHLAGGLDGLLRDAAEACSMTIFLPRGGKE